MIKKEFKLIILIDFDSAFRTIVGLVKEVAKSIQHDEVVVKAFTSSDISSTNKIPDKIQKLMAESDGYIADLSSFNSNVLFEIGYMTALGLNGIILNRGPLKYSVSKKKRLPIYISTDNILSYFEGPENYSKLKKTLKMLIKDLISKNNIKPH